MRQIDFLMIGVQVIWGIIEISILLRKRSSIDNSKSKEFRYAYAMYCFCLLLGVVFGILLRINNSLNLYSNSVLFPLFGILLMIIGSSIRLIAISTLKKAFTVNLAISKDQQLIEKGFYKVIRHPAYLGSIISFLGFGICYGNIVSILIIAIPYIFYIVTIIKYEEKMLIEKFGDEYKEYMEKTYRLIPFVF